MLKQTARLLADCSVGQKLLLGFGLVSVLAVAATAQGLYATVTLLEHSRQVSAMMAINRMTLQMRNAEKAYALDPQPQAMQEVEGLMQALGAQLQTLEQQAVGDGLSLLVALQQFIGHQRLAAEALRHMQEQAEQARLQFEMVELDMYDQVRNVLNSGQVLDGDPLSLAEQASALQRRCASCRSAMVQVWGGPEDRVEECRLGQDSGAAFPDRCGPGRVLE